MALTIADIERLFAERGGEQHSGEPVTQLEHALQSALQAENEDADDELVTAALLHDLGATPTLQGGLFSAGVTEPIKLHVDAKRYLCATRPGYHDALSADSQRSLVLQGGVFSEDQAQAFIGQPGAIQAVRVRTWDDLAKQQGRATPPLSHYLKRARRCARIA